MFEQMFKLAVVISAVDNLTAPLAKMGKQLGIAQKQSAALQKQMARFKATALVGGAITGIGVGLAVGLLKAAGAAGKLQTSMMGVQAALKLNPAEFNQAMNMAQTTGIPTIFSAEQVGGIMQSMATSGLNKQQVLDPSILRQYVNFADVQAQVKKEDPNSVVSSAVGMAHMFQMYTTSQVQPFLNKVNAALLHTSDTASEFATTFRYIAGQSKMMGVNGSDTLATTSWLVRMGFGSGRGGTNYADFLKRSIYGSSGKKDAASNVQSGFFKNRQVNFQDAAGNFVGIPAAVKILQNFGNKFHHDAAKMSPLLNSIFGAQGGRIAMMMTTSGAATQYTNVQKQLGNTASISQTQEALNNTWQGKMKQFETTLQDIGQAFGRSVVPMLMPLVTVLDNILGRVLKFEQAHPEIMKWITTFIEIAAAASLIIGPMLVLVGVIGYLSASRALTAGFSLFGTAFRTALGPIGLLATAIYVLYQAWTHNWGGIQQKTHSAIAAIKAEIGPFLAMMNKALQTLGIEQVSHKTVGKPEAHGNHIAGLTGSQLTTVRSFKIPSWVKWGAGVLLGTKALTGMLGATTRVIGSVNSLVGVFSKLGSLSGLLLKFVGFIGRITGVTKLWTAAQAVFNAVADANPISLIIIGVVALIAVVVLLIMHWKQVVAWVENIANRFNKLGAGVKLLILTFAPFIGLPLLIISHWKPIETFFNGLFKTVGGVLKGVEHFFGIGGGSKPTSYATLSPGASGNGGDTNIHLHGNIVVQGGGNGVQAGKNVYKGIVQQAKTATRSRGTRPTTSYAR